MSPSTPLTSHEAAPAPDAALTRPERLARLPFARKHLQLLFASGTGWALDAMDVGLISFVMVALAKDWHLTNTDKSWLLSVGFVGMALGATFGGALADRFGRRTVFAVTLMVYGIATGASALATGLTMLLVLRFLVGLGLGAELPVASTLVSELSPTRIRGRMVVALESFWAVGWILAALVGFFVVPRSADGWRWAFALGVLPAVYAVVARFGLPESVSYLERRGRHDQAEKVTRQFEASAGVSSPETTRPLPEAAPRPTGMLWSKEFRGRTAAMWTVWFCVNLAYYGAFLWIPTILVARGFAMTKSFEYTLIITLAQLPGYALSAYLVEKLGRRRTLALFLVGSALAAAAFGLARSDATIVAAGCALSFFNLGAWGALYAIGPEIYPTMLRGSGTGAAAGFGRIASIVAPFMVPWLGGLARSLGVNAELLTFAVFGGAFLLAAGATFALPEQRGRSLEQ